MVWQLCAIWTGCLASIVDLVTLLLCTTWICLDSLISCSPKIQKLLDLFCVTVWILMFGMPCTILMYYLAPLLLPNSTSKLDLSQFCSLYSFDLRNCTVVSDIIQLMCMCEGGESYDIAGATRWSRPTADSAGRTSWQQHRPHRCRPCQNCTAGLYKYTTALQSSFSCLIFKKFIVNLTKSNSHSLMLIINQALCIDREYSFHSSVISSHRTQLVSAFRPVS